MRARWGAGLLLFFLGLAVAAAQEDKPFFVAPGKPLVAAQPGFLRFYCLNSSSHMITRTFEPWISARLMAGGNHGTTLVLSLAQSSSPEVNIPPGGFASAEYDWMVPASLNGPVTLEVSNYNSVALQIVPVSAGPALADQTAPPPSTSPMAVPQSPYMNFLTNHLSTYEPIYFILGTYPAAEFQFSIKYKVFNVADGWNPLGHLYFAYTQTSFWDLLSSDPSFYDSSYKPSAFLYYPDVVDDGIFHLDLQPGFEHESNGKGGTEERSLYTAYLQPTATWDLPANFQFLIQPRAWVYADVGNNNETIANYRGYGYVSTALNWTEAKPFSWSDPEAREKVQLALKFETGDDGGHDAWKLDLRFNLAFLPALSKFNPTVQVQYFTGYGQTLRQYNEYSHGLRAGLCLWY